MSNEKITSDIYDISKTILDIQKNHNEDIVEDTLAMGIFGHIAETMTKIARNSVINAAENGNEAIYLKSKFERTILSNAIFHNIENINAIPSVMPIMMCFYEQELIEKMGDKNYVIIDKDIPLNIDDEESGNNYEFHLDYDLVISRSLLKNGEYAYSARYKITDPINPISDITNPYLSSPIKLNISYSTFICINCNMRQVILNKINSTIKSDIFIDNKTFDFDFENQLAYFTINVEETDNSVDVVPVFDNMPPASSINNYCYYTYNNENSIRIKFDRRSYIPKTSSKININVYTTLGADGNFKYKNDIQLTLESEKYGYDNFMCLIRPVDEADNGKDKKGKEDLKMIIPKEVLSRGCIITTKDIQNYFLSLDSTRLYFYKKRHNQFERLYYAYMIIMDSLNNIVPTNTITMNINHNDFDMIKDNRLIINTKKMIKYKNGIGNIIHDVTDEEELVLEDNQFIYTSPFIMVVNTDPVLSVSYYSTNVNIKRYLDYSYINIDSPIQFICNSVSLDRHYLRNNDNYVLKLSLLQNIQEEFDLVQVDKDTQKIIGNKLRVIITFKDDKNEFYVEGELVTYDSQNFIYDFEVVLNNDNMIDKYNRMRINHVKKVGDNEDTYSFFDRELEVKVYVYIDNGDFYGDYGITKFPDINNVTLSNIFTTLKPIELFYNYSGNIDSIIKPVNNPDDGTQYFEIKSVPVIRYSYFNDYDKSKEFLNYLSLKKAYIDSAVNVLEGSFQVDLKFFNTYGPSKMFYIGHENEVLDRINLSFKFRVKLLPEANENIVSYIKDSIKEFIENINDVSSLHMTNLCKNIKETYSNDINFIEFVKINNYDATYQYLEKIDVKEIEDVPEFINVNTLTDGKADINIEVV